MCLCVWLLSLVIWSRQMLVFWCQTKRRLACQKGKCFCSLFFFFVFFVKQFNGFRVQGQKPHAQSCLPSLTLTVPAQQSKEIPPRNVAIHHSSRLSRTPIKGTHIHTHIHYPKHSWNVMIAHHPTTPHFYNVSV